MMKNYLLTVTIVALAVSCGDTQKTPAADTAKSTALVDTTPRQIIGGKKTKVGSWAYPLDSALNTIRIGYPDALKGIINELGAQDYLSGKNRESIRLLNREKTEIVTISICKNAKNEWVPYALLLAKYDEANVAPGRKPVALDDRNYFTSNKASMNYSEDYFLKLFSEQPLMTWAKGDTVYYTHQGQPKDASRLKLWKPEDYMGRYKFVDGRLCELSLYVKPESIEASK